MSRHVADRQEVSGGARLQRYVEVERHQTEEGAHPAARALHERPAKRGAARLRQFLKIERGWTA